jgi:hypothetical protein
MAAVRSFVAAVAVTALAITLGVAVRGSAEPGAAPTPSAIVRGTPLSAYDTSGVVVERAAFCAGIDPDSVAAALGSDPESASSYDNGESARVTRTVKDVAHEFGCTWQAPDGTVARAWLFAPPITPGRARDLVADASAAHGCEAVAGAPAFGSPSVATSCASDTDLQASYRGLFGDAWLACSITAPVAGTERPELLDRAGRWCVAVARAASHPTV